MGNVMDSFFTGFFHSMGNFFGSPLDFLSGKSCRVGVRKDHRTSDSGLSQHAVGVGPGHGIKVSRESKFARKGSKRRTRVHRKA
ncbi:unnamed protein product [Thlaspi arvense]|uniref:Ribosomal protein L2 n=1 Tax=Thlaspi arvense TaxID=13288 RepID=A0AAU9R8Y8_THLAR|nr:unnamed protein product [Thlaspi arvense]